MPCDINGALAARFRSTGTDNAGGIALTSGCCHGRRPRTPHHRSRARGPALPSNTPLPSLWRWLMPGALDGRVSTRLQTQTPTIDQQIERLCADSDAQGWHLPEPHIFRADGYSGASLRRPGLDRRRDYVAAAQFEKILVTDPARLARHDVHQVLLLEALQKNGCPVEC